MMGFYSCYKTDKTLIFKSLLHMFFGNTVSTLSRYINILYGFGTMFQSP